MTKNEYRNGNCLPVVNPCNGRPVYQFNSPGKVIEMTPEYILRKSLCRPPNCGDQDQAVNIRRANSEIDNLTWSNEYAEPGYTQPQKAVLFANWNYFPRGIDTILENYGYSIEWSDEWATCGSCGKAVRTSADSYGWQPSYVIENECELTCVECIKDDPTAYLESLEDNPSTALNIRAIDPAKHGYQRILDHLESGMHQGQTDDPKKIFAKLQAEGRKRILFRIDTVGQFDMQFSAWEHTPEDQDVTN